MTIQVNGKATTTKSLFRMEVAVGMKVRATPAAIWSLLTNALDFPRWNSTIQDMQGTIAPGETISLVAKIAPTRTFK